MSYKREYEGIRFSYSLPSKNFHPSRVLEDYVERISSEKGITPEELIDCYVKLYLVDLQRSVTQMIYHDGNSSENYVIDRIMV